MYYTYFNIFVKFLFFRIIQYIFYLRELFFPFCVLVCCYGDRCTFFKFIPFSYECLNSMVCESSNFHSSILFFRKTMNKITQSLYGSFVRRSKRCETLSFLCNYWTSELFYILGKISQDSRITFLCCTQKNTSTVVWTMSMFGMIC